MRCPWRHHVTGQHDRSNSFIGTARYGRPGGMHGLLGPEARHFVQPLRSRHLLLGLRVSIGPSILRTVAFFHLFQIFNSIFFTDRVSKSVWSAKKPSPSAPRFACQKSNKFIGSVNSQMLNCRLRNVSSAQTRKRPFCSVLVATCALARDVLLS